MGVRKGPLRGLSLNVVALGLTSFFTDVSSEMIFALLPFFMVEVLQIKMAIVGLIEGAAESMASVLKVFSGWLSDKVGKRKAFAVAGYSLSTFLKPLFAFATSATHVFSIRVFDRVGKGLRTSPRDALIADSVEAGVLGKAYGLHRSMDTLGAVVGPLVAFALFPALWYRGVFLFSLLPGSIAVLVLIFLVKEGPKGLRKETKFLMDFKSLPRNLKLFILIAGLFNLSNFSYAFFLLRAGTLGVKAEVAPLLYLLFNVVYALSAYPLGAAADRIGKKLVLAFGYGMFGLTCFGFALAKNPLQAVGLFVAYGVFFAASDTLQRALVPDLGGEELRGTAFGALHSAIGFTALPSSFIAGALWQTYGPTFPFAFSGALSLFSAFLLFALLPLKPGRARS